MNNKSLYLLVILLIASVAVSARASMIIKIMDCRVKKELTYLSKLTILKDNKLYKELKPAYESTEKLNGLDTGIYTLCYKSLFNIEEKTQVHISEYKTYSVDICMDYIDHSKEPLYLFIDSLQNGEHYKINVYSQGCFHHSEDSIFILKENNLLKAIWNGRSRKLSSEDVAAIQKFEMDLPYINGGLCTTVDLYILIYKDKTLPVSDGSCSWRGFSYLCKQLFGEAK